MKRQGSSIIFVNDHNQVLLFLRDNIPEIPFPNMWDVPGGHVEKGETPGHCIVREMKEEMDIDLSNFHKFSVYNFPDRTEYVYWKKANIDIATINLMEGQMLKWFSKKDVDNTELACGFNEILIDFFMESPFAR